VLDPRSLQTSYTIDGLGNTGTLASPDTGSTGATFDDNGNVLTRTDARGMTTTYAYDALNRLTSATYASGTPTVYEYDGGASPAPYSIGHLTKITDESGKTEFTYDFRGNVVKKVQTIGTKVLTTQYDWGSAGGATAALTSVTYPSLARVNYLYDAFGRVSALTLNPVKPNGTGTAAATIPLLSNVSYDGRGVVTGWTWSDGVAYKRTFDGYGRLASYPLGNPAGTGISAGVTRTLGYDNAAQILSYTHRNAAGAQASFDQQFGYDNLGRLTSQTLATTSYGYAYDATGNRTATQIGATSYALTVSPTSNQYAKVQSSAGTASQTYDKAGNLLNDTVLKYTVSPRGRMSAVKIGTSTVSYLVNGLEQRVSKTGPTALVATGAAYYAYDEAGQVLGEYGATLAPVYETVYLGPTPVGVVKQTGQAGNATLASVAYNVYADQIDAPRVITRSTDEAIVWRWDGAEAFGATGPVQDPSGLGAFSYNQRFPGQVFDAESGNFYNWNRDYNPALGRYTESDPIGLAGGSMSTYGYVESSPLTNVDPFGLQTAAVPGMPPLPMYIPGTQAYQQFVDINSRAAQAVGDWMASTANGIKSSVEQARERKEYSRVCKSPIPPSGDKCKDAKANLDRLKQCLGLREAYSKKWFNDNDPGHVEEIQNTRTAISKLEDYINQNCPKTCP